MFENNIEIYINCYLEPDILGEKESQNEDVDFLFCFFEIYKFIISNSKIILNDY